MNEAFDARDYFLSAAAADTFYAYISREDGTPVWLSHDGSTSVDKPVPFSADEKQTAASKPNWRFVAWTDDVGLTPPSPAAAVGEAEEFDARDYFLAGGAPATAQVVKELMDGFRLTPGKLTRDDKKRGVVSLHGSFRNSPFGLTRTYLGHDLNRTWSVDWIDGQTGRNLHTSGPQDRIVRFMQLLDVCLHTNWMTAKQAMLQAARDAEFDTSHLGESEDFNPREYLLDDPAPKTPEQSFEIHGYDHELGDVYNRFWPVKDGFRLNVGGKHQSAYGNVRTWAAVTDDNGAAYFGQYTVPVAEFEQWLDKADKVMPSLIAAANAAEDVTSAQGYAAMQAAWEVAFPYTPDVVEAEEPFDAREYMLSDSGDEYALRQFVTDSPATMATVMKPSDDEYVMDVRRQDGKSQRFGPFRRDQIRMFNREWHGFKYAGWSAGPSVTDRDKLFSMFEAEDFDPRDYLLTAPADYVVKWTFGPPKPDQRLYRYTRINGVTSEESALREWQAKMVRDWGWRVGDDKKPHLVKVVRAAIQDRPVQEADDFNAAEYLSTMPKTEMDVLRSHGYVDDDPPRWHRDWPLSEGYFLSIMAQPELDKVHVYVAINDYAESGALFLGFYDVDYEKLDAHMTELERGVVPIQQKVAELPPNLFDENQNVEMTLREVWAQHTPPSKRFHENAEGGPPDEAFTEAMQQATAEFVADEKNMVYGGGRAEGRRIGDGYDINCGMCEEWAERVRQLYQEATGNDAVEVLDPGSLTGNPDDSLAGHVFLRFNGRFYDSECPQGVFHWNQLPLFLKQMDESEEPFDARDYLLHDEASCLDDMGFERMPASHVRSGERLWSRTQGSIRLDVHNYGDDEWFVLGWVNENGEWKRHDIESYYTGKGITLKQVIENIDASCRGVDESLAEPPAEEPFDPRQYFIDSSAVQFNVGGKREVWNFGADKAKQIWLYGQKARVELEYYPDEWRPKWVIELYTAEPWKGPFEKLRVKTTCGSERLLPKRIETILTAAEAWWEKHQWGLKLFDEMRFIHDNHANEWSEFLDTHAGDLPSDYADQTEETAHAWGQLMLQFYAENHIQPVQEAEGFDPREYFLDDKGPALVARLKELGYLQVNLNVMTDRHAVLSMNDPNPEYDDEEEGGGIDQTKRMYARNRVKTAVRELMGLSTNVYDFSGDGGTDYLYKICDPEHMGVHGRFEAKDTFDPREYFLGMPKDLKGWWRVRWHESDGTLHRTKPFFQAEKAMRFVYTSSLWNKAEDIVIERAVDSDDPDAYPDDYTIVEYPVTRDYELIDPDTGSVLIRESLVIQSENQDFSARDYVLAPDEDIGRQFMDWLVDIGFDPRGDNTYELNQWGTRFIVQRYKNGKYRYAVYDPDGHKMRGQMTTADELVTLLQQHLNMKLREGEEPFDAREYLTRDPDEAVLSYMKANGFRPREADEYPGGEMPKFYAVWIKDIGRYSINAFRGQKDDKLGSSRWWLEVHEDRRNTSPGMGNYFSAENFLPRLQAQVRMKTDWAEYEQRTATNA